MTTIEDENIKSLLSIWGLAARVCDSCCTATAVLYCQAHTAFICSACDVTLHLQARHERVFICDVCQQAQASVTCKADAANLCPSCDSDIHAANPLASRHQRLPVVPFVGPTGTIGGGAQETDTWLIHNPDLVYLQNEQVDYNSEFGFGECAQKAIPSLTVPYSIVHEHNGGDCGVSSESTGILNYSNDYQLDNNGSLMPSCFDIDLYPSNKIDHQHQHQVISAFNNYAAQPSVSSSDVAVVPDSNSNFISKVSKMTKSINTVTGEQVSPEPAPVIDRQARVMRFKEKRKNRKFEKTIRYASRKAYAEARPRNKGRFTKRTELNETSDNDDQVFGFRLGSDWFPDEMLDTVSLHNFDPSS